MSLTQQNIDRIISRGSRCAYEEAQRGDGDNWLKKIFLSPLYSTESIEYALWACGVLYEDENKSFVVSPIDVERVQEYQAGEKRIEQLEAQLQKNFSFELQEKIDLMYDELAPLEGDAFRLYNVKKKIQEIL